MFGAAADEATTRCETSADAIIGLPPNAKAALLGVAVQRGQHAMVRNLLDGKADVNALVSTNALLPTCQSHLTGHRWTALTIAAMTTHQPDEGEGEGEGEDEGEGEGEGEDEGEGEGEGEDEDAANTKRATFTSSMGTIVQHLLSSKAELEGAGKQDWPLLHAVRRGNMQVAWLLLAAKASLSNRNTAGRGTDSLAIWAVAELQPDALQLIVSALLRTKASVDDVVRLPPTGTWRISDVGLTTALGAAANFNVRCRDEKCWQDCWHKEDAEGDEGEEGEDDQDAEKEREACKIAADAQAEKAEAALVRIVRILLDAKASAASRRTRVAGQQPLWSALELAKNNGVCAAPASVVQLLSAHAQLS